MGIDSIIGSNAIPNVAKQQDDLGKDAFLKLMLIQMKNQDPLNPMDNQAMLSQMAQFSSLEQMSNLNDNFSSAKANETAMQATGLLGKKVEVHDPNSPPDQPGTMVSTVKAVMFTDKGPALTLENGYVATVDQLIGVAEAE